MESKCLTSLERNRRRIVKFIIKTKSIAPVGLNYSVGDEKIGNTYHVHNTLIYAEPLANGHSPQAPAGWVDIVARQMTNRARQLADNIGRQD